MASFLQAFLGSWALDTGFLSMWPLSWTESSLNLTRSPCLSKGIGQSGHLQGLLMLGNLGLGK